MSSIDVSILRTIIEEHAFEKDADTIIGNNQRAAELIDAIKWRLARSSAGSYSLPGSNLKLIKTEHRPAYGLPAITVLFREDKHQVILIAIKCM